MSNEPKQELAQVANNGELQQTGPAGLSSMLFQPGRVAASSLDLKTESGQLILQKCEESQDSSLRELANTTIALQHIYCKYVDTVDPDSGEVRTYLRICLIDDAGKVYACGSAGVAQSLARFIASRNMPPWNPPIRCVVRIKALKDKKQRIWLELLAQDKKGGAK